jgi:hypothetical protein
MTPQQELDLVKQAILLGQTVTGCCEWHERAFQRVAKDSELLGLTAAAIRQLLIEFVVAGGVPQQVKEQRPEYNDYEFYYKAVLPLPGLPHGLFVEMRLVDADVDCPVVLLVNAHPQHK